jgi:hypothetical protein
MAWRLATPWGRRRRKERRELTHQRFPRLYDTRVFIRMVVYRSSPSAVMATLKPGEYSLNTSRPLPLNIHRQPDSEPLSGWVRDGRRLVHHLVRLLSGLGASDRWVTGRTRPGPTEVASDSPQDSSIYWRNSRLSRTVCCRRGDLKGGPRQVDKWAARSWSASIRVRGSRAGSSCDFRPRKLGCGEARRLGMNGRR